MKLFLTLFITVLSLQTYAQQASSTVPDYGNNAEAGKYLQTRGIKLYYEVYGEGEPLLMIHGNSGSINNFKNQIPYFSQHYQVILADSRAQGRTIDTKDSLSYEMMADDLSALLSSMHKDSCYVIGWSDGAINAMLLASRHPEKVKKLAFTGGNLRPDRSVVDSWVYEYTVAQGDSLKRLAPSPTVKNEIKLNKILLNEPHITAKELAKIKCPTLVIGGDHDILLPKHTLEIAEGIENSYLWILPNSGHATPIHYKDLFNSTVGDFFKTPYKKVEKYGRFY